MKMTPEQFVYWLIGYASASDGLSAHIPQAIITRLASVVTKEEQKLFMKQADK
ncbi:MAG TPA: hypothetical protein VMW10_11345 [Alphaproteobacteria bacterium]|nr:hypothetical protein [Alphaproteobacteria bacterium]